MSTPAPQHPGLPPGAGTPAGARAVEAMRRVAAERNRVTARFLEAVDDAGRACADGTVLAHADRFSADEVAAALGWSASMAGRWRELATDLCERLPQLLLAMHAGILDETKARAISEWTRDLAADHARLVADRILPDADRLTLATIIERVQDLAVALDPAWAARRAARARRRARLVGTITPDGTASLSGHDLPLAETADALAHVEALADRVHGRGIDEMPIQQLRTVVYLRLLRGFGAGLDDTSLVDALVEHLLRHPSGDGPGDGAGAEPDRPGPDEPGPDESDDNGPEPDGPDDDGPDDNGPDDNGPDDNGPGPDGPSDGGGGLGAPDGAEDHGPETGAEDDGDRAAPPIGARAPATRGRRRGTLELRVRLSTLLGLDDLPARMPRWGVMLADEARAWVRDQPDAEWRLVITDPAGHLRHVLLTRHRPTFEGPRAPGPRASGPRRRGNGDRTRGILEIQIPATLLADLDPADHPPWTRLLTDARTRLADLPPDGDPDRRPHARTAATRRRARAELDRWIRTRDRHCTAPGCRRPAVACDLDHTQAWAHHGPSAAANLGALCRRHHRLKHLADWTVTQPAPGRFHWCTRAGLHYRTGAHRILHPLPAPAPPSGRRRPLAPELSLPAPRTGLHPRPTGPDPGARPHPRVEPVAPVLVGATLPPSAPRTPPPAPLDDEPPPF